MFGCTNNQRVDNTININKRQNKKRDKKDLYTKKTIEEDSWIAIEYTDKRFEKIRQVLPNCPTVIKEAE